MAVAIYWDFENVHAALIERQDGEGAYRGSGYFKPQRVVLEVDKIMDYVFSLGDVFINRAYANWQWLSKYSHDLLDYSVDLVQLFPRGRFSKNGADIRLALDVLEDTLRFPHISHVVIISGDSDYISVAQKIQQLGKMVYGIGVEQSTNPFWIKACNEFKFYGKLLAKIDEQPEAVVATNGHVPEEAQELLLKALRVLTVDRNQKWVRKALVRPTMKRLDPSFDEVNYGYRDFNDLVKSCEFRIETRKDDHDHLLALHPSSAGVPTTPAAPIDTPSGEYDRLLRKQGVYVGETIWRLEALRVLHNVLTTTATPMLTWPLLDDSIAHGLAEAGQNADLPMVKKFRSLLIKAHIVRLGPDGVKLAGDMVDGHAMEKAVARLVITRIVTTDDEPIDPEALRRLLYGLAFEPPIDLPALIAEMSQPQDTGVPMVEQPA